MTKEEVIALAREAGCKPFRSPEHWDDVQVFATPDVLERFATLVAAHEREECAKVCEDYDTGQDLPFDHAVIECAAAIRSRT